MAKIESKYLGRDFDFEPAKMSGDDGNPITIIPHNILFDIIQNKLHESEKTTYEYRTHLISRDHAFVECVMSDRRGRCVREFGESVQESLKSEIAKTIPGTMAAIRAFDRAAIRFLDFDCEGKVYSDNEISTDGLKSAGNSEGKKVSQPASKVDSKQTAKKEEQNSGTQTAKAKSSMAQKSAQSKSFSMTVPSGSKLSASILEALEKHDELITFDTETTGLKPEDRIMEIAAQKYQIDHAANTLKLVDELQLYINPEMKELDPDVVDLTGITLEFLMDKPTEAEAFIDIYNFFGDNPQILCGYNTAFDIRFLSELYKRQGKTLTVGCKLDVYAMAKELITGSPDYKLGTISGLFGLEGDEFHSASADADYTTRLLNIFVDEYRKASGVSAAPVGQQEAAPVPAAEPSAPAESDKNETVSETVSGDKVKPVIQSMTLFTPSQAIRRIYVNTDAQTVYYDLVKKQWMSKDADLSKIDMDYLEKEAWKIAGANSLADFEAFSGKWSAEAEQKAA